MRKLFLILSLLAISLCAAAQQTRHFIFHYSFTVKDIPSGSTIRVWIPAAQQDPFQEITVIGATGDLPLKSTRESEYGNEMYFATSARTDKPELHFAIDYDVIRHERVAFPASHLTYTGPRWPVRRQDVQANALVPITGVPADLAVKVTEGKSAPLDKARAIYEYVFSTMRYDKTGKGWGRGDVLYACDAKKGNCTDFHSLFIAMARSQGIPARFEIGFPIPEDKHSGEIAGYHCWSDFYVESRGWIPVDISEAWKHPEKRDYFFGAHDANRVQFSLGRDLRLKPPQNGKPLNYFVYPYVEVDGKEHSNVSLNLSFEDVPDTKARN